MTTKPPVLLTAALAALLAGTAWASDPVHDAAAKELAAIRFELHFGVEARLCYHFTSEAVGRLAVRPGSTTKQEFILVVKVFVFDE